MRTLKIDREIIEMRTLEIDREIVEMSTLEIDREIDCDVCRCSTFAVWS